MNMFWLIQSLIHSISIFWVFLLCQIQVQYLRYKDGYNEVPAIGIHWSSPNKTRWKVGQEMWRGVGRFKKHLGGIISSIWWWVNIRGHGRKRHLEWSHGLWLNTWEKCAGIPEIENVEEKEGVVGNCWERAGRQVTMSRLNFWGKGSHW